MKKLKLRFVWLSLSILMLVIGTFIGFVPQVHAQSIEGWTEPVNLSNSGSSTDPTIVIDSTGVIHVIWFDQFEGYRYTKSADGVKWTTPKTVQFPFSPVISNSRGKNSQTETEAETPVLLADQNNRIHALWRDKDTNTLYYSNATVSEERDLTSGWASRTRLADSVIDFDAEISSKGILHVGYVSSLGENNNPVGVFYRQLIDGTWSSPQNVYSSEYFRSLTAEDANVSLAVSEEDELETVYMVWDDRPQKRIFMVKSIDSGLTWAEANQIKEPEELTGYQTPFNGEINTYGNTILFLWQVGNTSNHCVQYSQSILNEGGDWGEPIKLLGENLGCPRKTKFFSLEQNLSVLLLDLQGGLSLIAWNGNVWSDPRFQSELLDIYNPTTFDSVHLGCQQFSILDDVLYLVGCDQGSGGDIWFTSRLLGSVEDWYPTSSDWSSTGLITNTEQMISSMSSVGYLDSVHLFWVQSARSDLDEATPFIQYSRWNDESWSTPRPVITNLTGKPLQISVTHDLKGRLLLVWVDEKDGNLYFSWADSKLADRSSEWNQPVVVPSISQLNSSPDVLVDASGRIFITYAVNLNEGRGIYMVQSSDLGNSWSSPVRVFDAVSAGWERIDNPKISLSGDGRIHLIFSRYSFRNDEQSTGMFYMQSADGGTTWSEPELVAEGSIAWSEIYSYDQQVVHRVWQENNGLEVSYIDQLSFDDGITWEAPVKIIGANVESTQIALATDQVGVLRLAQLSYGEEVSLQDWKWDKTRWILQGSKDLDLRGDGARYSIENNVTSDGKLVVSILLENSDLAGNKIDEIWSLHRNLDITEIIQDPILPLIPTPNSILATTEEPNITPTSNLAISPPANLNEPPPANRKNFVGWLLVVAILILAFVIIWSKRKK